ncbi:MAG: DUF4900 domain-containing protein [Trueperaceae bacterium]
MTPTPARRRGVALITALAILVVVSGIAALMFTRTLSEVQHSGDDTGIVQSLLLARGAANLAGAVMQVPVRAQLNLIVNADSSTVDRWSFGTGTGDRPESASVAQALSTNATSVANKLQDATDALLCDTPVPGLGGGETAALRVYFTPTACGVDLPGDVDLPTGRFIDGDPRTGSGAVADQDYALPFVVVAEGSVGDYTRRIVTSGEYKFKVGRGSFAQYALFTNVHTTERGTNIWFTGRTLFDGPVHTNQNFRFYDQPWFGGTVTSAGCSNPTFGSDVCTSTTTPGASFYGAGFQTVPQIAARTDSISGRPVYTNYYGTHSPEFAESVSWNAEYVPLPENTLDQRQAALDAGIASGRDLSLLELVAGQIDTTSPLPGAEQNMRPLDLSATPAEVATHQVIRACFTRSYSGSASVSMEDADGNSLGSFGRSDPTWTVCDEYRYTGTGTDAGRLETRRLVYDTADGVPSDRLVMYSTFTTDREWRFVSADPGLTFNGVVHVDGDIDRVRGPARVPPGSDDPDTAPPALASFGQITVAAEEGVRITSDLKYEEPPCEGTPTRDAANEVVRAACTNLGATNILGIYAQGSSGSPADVLIGHDNSNDNLNAPADVTIHGVLMTSSGIVGVEDYDSGVTRGNVNLIGGVIEYHYGAFGTFNASTGLNSTGYGRAFTFDQRTSDGLAPPYFPTIGSDSVRDLVIFSYGQREQLE